MYRLNDRKRKKVCNMTQKLFFNVRRRHLMYEFVKLFYKIKKYIIFFHKMLYKKGKGSHKKVPLLVVRPLRPNCLTLLAENGFRQIFIPKIFGLKEPFFAKYCKKPAKETTLCQPTI